MVRSLWGERVRINALFLFAFSSAWTREANRTIRMQNSLPPRNLVNYPPNMGSSVGNRNLCLVKNSLEGEGVEELWLLWRAETAWQWLHAHYSPLWRSIVEAMAFLSGAKSGAIRSKEAMKCPWAPLVSLALHPPPLTHTFPGLWENLRSQDLGWAGDRNANTLTMYWPHTYVSGAAAGDRMPCCIVTLKKKNLGTQLACPWASRQQKQNSHCLPESSMRTLPRSGNLVSKNK